jgi:hypothetical protein
LQEWILGHKSKHLRQYMHPLIFYLNQKAIASPKKKSDRPSSLSQPKSDRLPQKRKAITSSSSNSTNCDRTSPSQPKSDRTPPSLSQLKSDHWGIGSCS